MQYQLPEDTYKDWACNQTRGFTPDERQKLVIEVVRRAIEDEKLYYTKDVYAFCVKQLCPSPDNLAKSAARVEGGEVGMDLYYARQYLDAQKRFAMEDKATAILRPQVGMVVGTIVLQDLKRYTGATITSISGAELGLYAKCGVNKYQLSTTSLGLMHSVDRAHERKLRKSSFAEFCSSLPSGESAPQPVVAGNADLLTLTLF